MHNHIKHNFFPTDIKIQKKKTENMSISIDLNPFYWIGIFGIIIYGLLLVYALFRLFESFLITNKSLKFFNYKISFHFIFCIYCSCETTYYMSILITGKYVFLILHFVFSYFTSFYFNSITLYLSITSSVFVVCLSV